MDGQEWALPLLFSGVDHSYFQPFVDSSSLSSAHFTKFCSSPEGLSFALRPSDRIIDDQLFLGWGPVSPTRDFDFTSCFEQGVLIPGGLVVFIAFALTRILQLENCQSFRNPSEHTQLLIRL